MTDTHKLQRIASFGYGVYSIPRIKRGPWTGTVAIADPLDGKDGFYLVVDSIAEAYDEMESAELLGVSQ